MVFLAFCNLSIFSHETSLSGRVFVVALSKCPQLLRPILGLGLYTKAQSQAIGLLSSFVRLTGSNPR